MLAVLGEFVIGIEDYIKVWYVDSDNRIWHVGAFFLYKGTHCMFELVDALVYSGMGLHLECMTMLPSKAPVTPAFLQPLAMIS